MKNRKNLLDPVHCKWAGRTKTEGVPIQNPVAKFAHQFNKAHVFEDKNSYRRKAKHRKTVGFSNRSG